MLTVMKARNVRFGGPWFVMSASSSLVPSFIVDAQFVHM